jgi:PAS domain S-box-containing protein
LLFAKSENQIPSTIKPEKHLTSLLINQLQRKMTKESAGAPSPDNHYKETNPEIFRLLVENSSDGMALFENNELVYASPSMNEIFGVKDFYTFKTYPDILKRIHPDDYNELTSTIENSRQNKWKQQQYQFRFKRDDGIYCWIENSVSRIYKNNGSKIKTIVTCRDITKNKETEQELYQQKEALKTIADNTTALIYIKDISGSYLFANKALEDVYKIDAGHLSGKKDTDITDLETAARFRKNDLAVIESKKPAVFEETQELEDGLHTAVSVKVPIFDKSGNVVSICGITTDITERKKEEQELVELKEKLELAITAGNLGLWEWYLDGNQVD